VLACQNAVRATEFQLVDGNSSVSISTSDWAMYNWTVDGVNSLYRQGFYFSYDGLTREKPLDFLPLTYAKQTGNTALALTYANSVVSITVNYTLLGGTAGSGQSNIGEQVRVVNLTPNPLPFHFFQYADFDLTDYSDNTVELGRNVMNQYNSALQTYHNIQFADTVISPGASHGEAGIGQTIFNKLIDNDLDTLNDFGGPITGDATWAFEWDPVIAPGGSFNVIIGKSQYTLVPEPSTFSLVPMGLMALGMARRFRRSSK
jgi:hypothetical protein